MICRLAVLRVASLVVVVAGCSFTPGTFDVHGDARPTDGPDADPNAPDASVDGAPQGIAYVQGAAFTNSGNNGFVAAAFPASQTAGDLNIVVVSWSDQNDMVTNITDAHFTMYFSATGLMHAQGLTQQIYYAPNIPGGFNGVSATMSNNVSSPKLRIFEYSGIAMALPVDMSQATNGNSNTAAAGPLNTTSPRELIFAAEVGEVGANGAGPSFTQRQLDNGDLVEDRTVDTTGAYSATAPLTTNGGWIMQLVSFKGI